MLNTNEYSPLNAIPAGNSNTILSIPLFGSFRYSRKAMIVSVNPEPNAAINPEIDVIFSSFIFLTMRCLKTVARSAKGIETIDWFDQMLSVGCGWTIGSFPFRQGDYSTDC